MTTYRGTAAETLRRWRMGVWDEQGSRRQREETEAQSSGPPLKRNRLELSFTSTPQLSQPREKFGRPKEKELVSFRKLAVPKGEEKISVITGDTELAPQPDGLKRELMIHQQAHLAAMPKIEKEYNGGILGDEMGLGKTTTILAFIYQQRLLGETGQILVVCPLVAVPVWLTEAGIFRFSVEGVHGEIHDSDAEIVVTTYETLQRRKELQRRQWTRVILDEAHYIRKSTKRFKSVSELQTTYRWCLTGSPINIDVNEIKRYLAFLQLAIKKKSGETKSDATYRVYRQVLRRFLKRTLRPDGKPLLELPPMEVSWLYASLTDEEQELYQNVLDVTRQNVSAILEGAGKVTSLHILTQLLSCRRLCNHPALIRNAIYNDCMVCKMAGPDYVCCDNKHWVCPSCITYGCKICKEPIRTSNTVAKVLKQKSSTKIDLIVQQAVLRRGQSGVIFSEWTDMLAILETYLRKENFIVFFYTGGMNAAARARSLKDFADSPGSVMLVSLHAGSVAVNLTSATYGIFTEPTWNPAIIQQAAARIHRYGQTKPTEILYIGMNNTIEMKVWQILMDRSQIADLVHQEKSNEFRPLQSKDFKSILDLD